MLDALFRNSLRTWVTLIPYGVFSYLVYGAICYRFALNEEEHSRLSGFLGKS
jgi:hypothetical protein